MPVCKQCGNSFPNMLKIEGKLRILNSRKYCLTCSPFGLHNTRPFGYVRVTSSERSERSCAVCNKPHIGRGRKCQSCQVNLRRFALKEKAVAYLGGKCIACGYSRCVAALNFHHRDGKDKSFGIGGSHCRSWEVIKAELDKCDLLCSNCHAERHWKEHESARNLMVKSATYNRVTVGSSPTGPTND